MKLFNVKLGKLVDIVSIDFEKQTMCIKQEDNYKYSDIPFADFKPQTNDGRLGEIETTLKAISNTLELSEKYGLKLEVLYSAFMQLGKDDTEIVKALDIGLLTSINIY